jgi:uncharacterized protein YciI
MKPLRSTSQLLSEARELEEASRLTESAALYQQLVDADPTNQQAVSRLLTVYRRLKDSQKELAVIDAALAAYAQKARTTQEKWLNAHPKAAKAGRAFLRSLGASDASSFGANAQVQKLQKRKIVVEKKLRGKSVGKKARKPTTRTKKAQAAAEHPATKHTAAAKRFAAPTKKAEAAKAREEAAAARKAAAAERSARAAAAKKERDAERRLAAEQKRQAAKAREEAAAARKAAAAERKTQAAAARKAATAERKAQAAAARKAAAAERKAEAAAARQAATAERKAEAERKRAAAAAAAIPSLFIVSLRYLAPLEAIDAMLPKHVAFLDKHFADGDFLVAGRQIPRTGGIIIARAKDRAAVERVMKQDPFLKNKLASVDIVEFAATRVNKKQWQLIR